MTTRIPLQSSSSPSRLRLDLRTVTLADAWLCGLNGIAYLAGAAVLDEVLGLATPWLLGLGGFLIVWAAVLVGIGARHPVRPGAVQEVALLNLAWVVGSIAVLLLGDLTTLGAVWCVLQAVAVTAFSVVQLRLVRKAR